MANLNQSGSLDEQIERWRSYLSRRHAMPAIDVAKLEVRLRDEIAGLTRVGLSVEEALGVALKRICAVDPRSSEFAREHLNRGWSQLSAFDSAAESGKARQEGIVAFGFAMLAAFAIKLPEFFGVEMERHEEFYLRNASLFVLPCLLAYFVWKRRLGGGTVAWLAGAFAVGALFANLPGFGAAKDFVPLTTLHLPIALSLAVGIVYAGGRWREVSGRMDFIRFSGELFIYYVLIALGGGVLTAFMALTFKSIGINIGPFIGSWLLPCGAAGALVVASWLVEAKQGMLERMAPMLTRLFTPLFAAMLIAFLVTRFWSGRGVAIERELLIGFDLLLVVVLGLLLYSLSARDPEAAPGVFDGLQVVLVVSALLADVVALWAIGARIGEFGFSPNRVAALGENVILLINLTWSAVLYVRFLIRRGSFQSLERWQTGYIPVYAAWAATVVIAFPLLFRWLG